MPWTEAWLPHGTSLKLRRRIGGRDLTGMGILRVGHTNYYPCITLTGLAFAETCYLLLATTEKLSG